MVNMKLSNIYIMIKFREYLPDDLMPNGVGFVMWRTMLHVRAKKFREKGYSEELIGNWIDRSIEATAKQIMKDQES